MTGLGESFEDFLDALQIPILVVDDNVRVLAANVLAREAVSKEMVQIKGYLGGEVFRCKHSRLLGGCGLSVHCKSCVIRVTVTKTFKSGKPCIQVPACLDLDTITGNRRIRCIISTEKVANAVLLYIDDT